MKPKKIIIYLCIGLAVLYVYKCTSSLSQMSKQLNEIHTPQKDSITLIKEQNAFNSVKREQSGDFLILTNSIFNHRSQTNNISLFIKYHYPSCKPTLFLKITGATWASRIHTIYLSYDGKAMPIEYINDIYPLEKSAANGKMYGKLEISIGEILTDFITRMAQGQDVSVAFVGDGIYDKFPVSDKEKQALEQILSAFSYFKK